MLRRLGTPSLADTESLPLGSPVPLAEALPSVGVVSPVVNVAAAVVAVAPSLASLAPLSPQASRSAGTARIFKLPGIHAHA